MPDEACTKRRAPVREQSIEQAERRERVDAVELERALRVRDVGLRQVHDRVHLGQRDVVERRGQVEGSGSTPGALGDALGVASAGDDLVTARDERADQVRRDETRRAGDEHPHRVAAT